MSDNDLEVPNGSFEEFDDGDQEIDSPELEGDETEGDEIDLDEQPEDEAEDDADELAEDEGEEAGSEDQVRVTLSDGEEVTLQELKDGYFREKDYTHKSTEVAQEREAVTQERDTLAERSQYVESTLANVAGFLEKLVPPEPSLQLAQDDPAAYQYQAALRRDAMGELGQILQMKTDLGQAKQGYSQEDMAKAKAVEEAELVKAMPNLADPARRAKFETSVRETAKSFGIPDDLTNRLTSTEAQILHFAGLGKKAVENRNNAKRRVEAPKKGRTRAAPPSSVKTGNTKAMERLSKSGTLEDALGIDFE